MSALGLFVFEFLGDSFNSCDCSYFLLGVLIGRSSLEISLNGSSSSLARDFEISRSNGESLPLNKKLGCRGASLLSSTGVILGTISSYASYLSSSNIFVLSTFCAISIALPLTTFSVLHIYESLGEWSNDLDRT